MKFTLTLLTTLFSLSSMAATSGTLILKGNVPQILSVTISPETVASALALHTSQQETRIAKIHEKSNSQSGYKITIDSANRGKLIRTDGQEAFSYNLKYNGQPLNLTSSVVINNADASAVSVHKDLTISYTGIPSEQMVAGDYVDNITFSIAAN